MTQRHVSPEVVQGPGGGSTTPVTVGGDRGEKAKARRGECEKWTLARFARGSGGGTSLNFGKAAVAKRGEKGAKRGDYEWGGMTQRDPRRHHYCAEGPMRGDRTSSGAKRKRQRWLLVGGDVKNLQNHQVSASNS